jgi:hypothetical protein
VCKFKNVLSEKEAGITMSVGAGSREGACLMVEILSIQSSEETVR